MSLITIKKYSPKDKKHWDDFVVRSKNAIFLFYRDYMNYHSDRFKDCSLIIYCNDKIVALLPAIINGNILISHGGLTFGGLLMDDQISTLQALDIFEAINNYIKSIGINKVIYKAVPYIYHNGIAEEDLYAISRICDAKLVKRDVSICISNIQKKTFSRSRKGGVKKGIANNLKIKESNDFDTFWRILSINLLEKHNAKPVHNIDEILLLSGRFPNNIKLYAVYNNEEMLGGTILYINTNVIHTQYISASPTGKRQGALDFLFHFLINEKYKAVPYFDFGTSSENDGKILNGSLLFQKEGFGGHALCYDTYSWEVS